jgi:hypothetical protein
MTLHEPMPASQAPIYPYVWWWRVRLPDRKGERCRVTAGGSLNSIRVEFADGFWVITSRWAVRLAAAVRTNPIHRQSLRRARPAVRRSNELRSRA